MQGQGQALGQALGQAQGQAQAAQVQAAQAQEQGLTWTSWEGLAGSHVHGQEQEQG
jgi:hypothetical protein